MALLAELAKLRQEKVGKDEDKPKPAPKPKRPAAKAKPKQEGRVDLRAGLASARTSGAFVGQAAGAGGRSYVPQKVALALDHVTRGRQVVEHLKSVSDYVGREQVQAAMVEKHAWDERGHSMDDADLQQELRQCGKVLFDASGNRLRFHLGISLANSEELLRYIKEHPTGTPASHVQHTYAQAEVNLAYLKETGRVYAIYHHGLKQDVLYPADESLAAPLDADIVKLWHATQVPAELPVLQAELRAAGFKSFSEGAKLKRSLVGGEEEDGKAGEAKKAKRQPNWAALQKRTNKHLPGLFQNSVPGSSSIDVLPPTR